MLNVNDQKWWDLQALKNIARARLTYGLANGSIKKQGCKKCGDLKVHGHHPDYKRPNWIVWLCRKHHVELHKRKGSYKKSGRLK